MEVCAKWGISPSHFHGGPNRWTKADRDKAIMWLIHDRERCGECGTHREKWFHADGKTRISPPPFVAKKTRCPGCEAKQRAEASIRKDEGRGVQVQMERTG